MPKVLVYATIRRQRTAGANGFERRSSCTKSALPPDSDGCDEYIGRCMRCSASCPSTSAVRYFGRSSAPAGPFAARRVDARSDSERFERLQLSRAELRDVLSRIGCALLRPFAYSTAALSPIRDTAERIRIRRLPLNRIRHEWPPPHCDERQQHKLGLLARQRFELCLVVTGVRVLTE